MTFLGVDVGGTFTDAVLLHDGPGRHGEGADRRAPGGLGARAAARARARARRPTSSVSRTGRPSRRTRCSSAAAPARRSSRPRASSTCSTCGGRTGAHLYRLVRARIRQPLVAAERCVTASPSGSGPDGVARAARPRARCPDARRRVRRSPSACCSPSATRRTSGGRRGAAAAAGPDVHVVASHEVAPEFREYERAATTAVDAVSRARASAVSAGACASGRGRRGCRSRSHAVHGGRRRRRGEAARAIRRCVLVSGPAGGVVGAARSSRPAGVRNAVASTWAARRPTCASSPAARRRGAAEREIGGLPDRAADGRHPHRRRGRRLDRLARRGRRAARGAAVGGRRPGPGGLRRAAGAADGDRRPPPPRPPPGGACRAGSCSTVAAAAAGARAGLDPPRRSVARRRTPRWCARCASCRSSAASTRAGSRSSPSAAPARCTRARSPRSSGSRRVLVRPRPGVLSGARARRRATSGAIASSPHRAAARGGRATCPAHGRGATCATAASRTS